MTMMRSLPLLVLLLFVGACSTTGRAPADVSSVGDSDVAPEARADDPAFDAPSEVMARLEQLEQQLADGGTDVEALRAVLTEWLEPGLAARLTEVVEEERDGFLVRVDALAAQLGLSAIAVEARALRYADLARRLPPDHIDVLRAEHEYGAACVDVRDFTRARGHLEHVVQAFDRLFPPDHMERLEALSNCASVLAALGEHESARPLMEEVHAHFERLLPADDLGLMHVKENLALVRRTLGDPRGALVLQEHVVATYERALPVDDWNLLRARANLSGTRYMLGDIDGATTLIESVHAAYERVLPSDHPSLLSSKLDLANMRFVRGDVAGAHALYEHVHAVYARTLPPEHPELLRCLECLSRAHRAVGDLAGALRLEEQVLALRERTLPADHPLVLRSKASLAVLANETRQYERALALAEEVHATLAATLSPDHPDLQQASATLAIAREGTGDVEGALALRREVLDVYERHFPPDHPDLLGARTNLALSLRNTGEIERALELLESVHAERQRTLPPEHPELLKVETNLATTLRLAGDLTRAVALAEHVLAAYERILPPGHPELLGAQESLALVLRASGDHERALALYEHVLAVYEEQFPPDHPDRMRAENHFAISRAERGDLEGALALFESVLAGYERSLPPAHPRTIEALANVAVQRHALGDVEGARVLFEEVLAAFEQSLPADHQDILRAKENVVSSLLELGDVAGAAGLMQQVHEARKRSLPSEHPELLQSTANLASVLFETGDTTGAAALREQVYAELAKSFPLDHPRRLDAALQLAGARLDAGDFDGASEALAALLTGQRAAAASIARQAPRIARAAAQREIERLAWVLSVAAHIEGSVSSEAAAQFDADIVAAIESLRAVAMASSETARAALRAPELESVLEQLARVRGELARRGQAAPDDTEALEAWRRTLLDLAERRDRLDRDVRRALSASGVLAELPTVASIAASLTDDAAFVGLLRHSRSDTANTNARRIELDESYVALVVAPSGTARRVDLGPAEHVDHAIDRWRAALGAPVGARGLGIGSTDGASDVAKEAGNELRALVLDPLFAAVPEAREFRIAADDALFLVPFDALPLGDGVVGDVFSIRNATSAHDLAHESSLATKAASLLVVGGVDYGGTAVDASFEALISKPPVERSGTSAAFVPLPGAASEADRIASLFTEARGGASIELEGGAATKAALVSRVREARYLHVATHGWFAPESSAVSLLDTVGDQASDELRISALRAQDTIVGFLPETLCGLALAGANNGSEGILTAEELATLDLSNCELAVLSACETNVGIRRAGQGIQSLQTALHTAGARTAITSLWKVDDAATRKLFELFYTKLWSEKLGPADALWQAKMALRNDGHPTRDWAGWVLTGDPD